MLVTSSFSYSRNVLKGFYHKIVKTRVRLTIKQQNLRLVFIVNNKILDWSSLKTFADDLSHTCIAKLLEFMSERPGNIVGKGENVGYQCLLLSLNVFVKSSSAQKLKLVIMLQRVYKVYKDPIVKVFFLDNYCP